MPTSPTYPVKKRLKRSGLMYTTDSDPGYSRRRCGKGFIYLGKRGTRLTGARTLKRIENIVIPPAWEDVWICPTAKGHLQATGRDARKRKQYVYHPDWETIRDEKKFDQLRMFADVLPRIRSRVTRDLARDHLDRRRVLALTVRIMDETLIRVGNTMYAKSNASYGLTTLQDQHVDLERDKAVFHFRGKSGKQQEVVVENDRLIGLVASCQDLPGQDLFQYRDTSGHPSPVRSQDVNDYLKSISGEDVTAKLFRTWGATVEAAKRLKAVEPPTSTSDKKKKQAQAVREVAEFLGNTPAVARNSYIAPIIFELFAAGALPDLMKRQRSSVRGLTADEQSVFEILERAHP